MLTFLYIKQGRKLRFTILSTQGSISWLYFCDQIKIWDVSYTCWLKCCNNLSSSVYLVPIKPSLLCALRSFHSCLYQFFPFLPNKHHQVIREEIHINTNCIKKFKTLISSLSWILWIGISPLLLGQKINISSLHIQKYFIQEW